jgi:hypothetical protein
VKPDGTTQVGASAHPTIARSYNAVEVNLNQKCYQMHFLDRGMHDDGDIAFNECATHFLNQSGTIRLKGGRRVKVFGSAYIFLGSAMTPCIRTHAPSSEIATVLDQYLKGRKYLVQTDWDHKQRVHDLYVADKAVSDADRMAVAMALI